MHVDGKARGDAQQVLGRTGTRQADGIDVTGRRDRERSVRGDDRGGVGDVGVDDGVGQINAKRRGFALSQVTPQPDRVRDTGTGVRIGRRRCRAKRKIGAVYEEGDLRGDQISRIGGVRIGALHARNGLCLVFHVRVGGNSNGAVRGDVAGHGSRCCIGCEIERDGDRDRLVGSFPDQRRRVAPRP